MNKVIAIVGLAGSGKTEAVDFLEKSYQLPRVYFGAPVFEEIDRRGWPTNPETEQKMRIELRKERGVTVMAEMSLPKIEEGLTHNNVIVESLYSWEEYLFMREKFGNQFKVIAVHSAPAIRYKRLAVRPKRPFNPEEAWKRDCNQIEEVHQGGPIAMADWIIVNDAGIDKLQLEADEAYQFLIKLGTSRQSA